MGDQKAYDDGYEDGRANGHDIGVEDTYEEIKGIAEDICFQLECSKRFGTRSCCDDCAVNKLFHIEEEV